MDAHNFQEFSEPALHGTASAGNVARLSNRARLQSIASILAMAVLRRRARSALNNDDALITAGKSSSESGEGLDLPVREKWLDLYGAEAPKYKKQFFIKRLAYRIQELFYGGLSEQARAHLRRLAANDPVATVKRRIPEERKINEAILPGTRLVRVWNDLKY